LAQVVNSAILRRASDPFSEKAGTLERGDVITVSQQRWLTDGRLRVRCDTTRFWTSVSASTGGTLLAPLSKSQALELLKSKVQDSLGDLSILRVDATISAADTWITIYKGGNARHQGDAALELTAWTSQFRALKLYRQTLYANATPLGPGRPAIAIGLGWVTITAALGADGLYACEVSDVGGDASENHAKSRKMRVLPNQLCSERAFVDKNNDALASRTLRVQLRSDSYVSVAEFRQVFACCGAVHACQLSPRRRWDGLQAMPVSAHGPSTPMFWRDGKITFKSEGALRCALFAFPPGGQLCYIPPANYNCPDAFSVAVKVSLSSTQADPAANGTQVELLRCPDSWHRLSDTQIAELYEECGKVISVARNSGRIQIAFADVEGALDALRLNIGSATNASKHLAIGCVGVAWDLPEMREVQPPAGEYGPSVFVSGLPRFWTAQACCDVFAKAGTVTSVQMHDAFPLSSQGEIQGVTKTYQGSEFSMAVCINLVQLQKQSILTIDPMEISEAFDKNTVNVSLEDGALWCGCHAVVTFASFETLEWALLQPRKGKTVHGCSFTAKSLHDARGLTAVLTFDCVEACHRARRCFDGLPLSGLEDLSVQYDKSQMRLEQHPWGVASMAHMRVIILASCPRQTREKVLTAADKAYELHQAWSTRGRALRLAELNRARADILRLVLADDELPGHRIVTLVESLHALLSVPPGNFVPPAGPPPAVLPTPPVADNFSADAELYFYIDRSGIPRGPYNSIQMQQWYLCGEFPAGMLVWRPPPQVGDSFSVSPEFHRSPDGNLRWGHFTPTSVWVDTNFLDITKFTAIVPIRRTIVSNLIVCIEPAAASGFDVISAICENLDYIQSFSKVAMIALRGRGIVCGPSNGYQPAEDPCSINIPLHISITATESGTETVARELVLQLLLVTRSEYAAFCQAATPQSTDPTTVERAKRRAELRAMLAGESGVLTAASSISTEALGVVETPVVLNTTEEAEAKAAPESKVAAEVTEEMAHRKLKSEAMVVDLTADSEEDEGPTEHVLAANPTAGGPAPKAQHAAASQDERVTELRFLQGKSQKKVCNLRLAAGDSGLAASMVAAQQFILVQPKRMLSAAFARQPALPHCLCTAAAAADAPRLQKFARFLAGRTAVIPVSGLGCLYIAMEKSEAGPGWGCRVWYAASGTPHQPTPSPVPSESGESGEAREAGRARDPRLHVKRAKTSAAPAMESTQRIGHLDNIF
jgi:hypothetical protein